MLTTKFQIQDDCVAPQTAHQSRRKIARRLLLAAVGIGVAVTALPALAVTYSDGTLDTTFDTDGIVTTNVSGAGDIGNSMAIQSDGKIVVVGTSGTSSGDFAITRYNADGSLDSSFGAGGKVTTDIGSSTNDAAYSVAIQSGDKIVVVGDAATGVSNQDTAIVRYNSDGTLDSTFGASGKTTIDVGAGTFDSANSVKILSNGNIVVAGQFITTAPNSDFYVLQLDSTGSLDTSFGTGGKTTVNIGNVDNSTQIALQSDGKIVLAGATLTVAANTNFAVVRFNADGTLDNGFGTSAQVITDIGSSTNDFGRCLAVQSDGKIIVAGWRYSGTNGDFALVRYNIDGTVDSNFGTNGRVTTDMGATNDRLMNLAIQSDGKIIATGGNGSFATTRYNNDGSLDATFGTGGKVVTAIGTMSAASDVKVQSDGKIVVAGASSTGGVLTFAVVRYGMAGSSSTTTVASSNNGNSTTNNSSSSGTNSPSDKTILSLSLKDIVDEGSALPGSSVTVDASGFTPQETVTVGVLGSKSSTKTTTANSSGSIKTKVTIPKSAKKSATVYAYGQSSKHGYRDTVNITRSSNLPGTGTNSSMFLFFSLLFLCAGISIIARRQTAK